MTTTHYMDEMDWPKFERHLLARLRALRECRMAFAGHADARERFERNIVDPLMHLLVQFMEGVTIEDDADLSDIVPEITG